MKILIGSHVSYKAPDYILGSLKEALSYNSTAFMIYTGAPQNTKRIPIDEKIVQQFQTELKTTNIDLEHIFVHCPYIINLASKQDLKNWNWRIAFLQEELVRTKALGIKTVILHPGSALSENRSIAIQNLAEAINQCFQKISDVKIALETMSGQGNEIGITFQELKQILDLVEDKQRLGVCLDTCHTYSAGYDLKNNFEQVLAEFDSTIGLKKLFVIHLNDTKIPFNGRKDRHENIGKGYLGLEALTKIVNHPKLMHVAKILETPYIDGKPPYKAEIELFVSNK